MSHLPHIVGLAVAHADLLLVLGGLTAAVLAHRLPGTVLDAVRLEDR